MVLARPGLKVVLEHCTTKEAAAFVLDGPPNVAATVTPQHLLYNRNALLAGGLRPHLYCMPILKAEPDRVALLKAVGCCVERHETSIGRISKLDETNTCLDACRGVTRRTASPRRASRHHKQVTSGSKKFFLGTDSAPHEVASKHTACGCAGVFSAHAALEM